MPQPISLQSAIDGFLLECEARHLSADTVRNYELTLRRFREFAGDLLLADVTVDLVRRFMAFLDTPQPRPGAVKQQPRALSKKTALNYHTALAALWTWSVAEGIAERNVVHQVKPPRPEQPQVVPLTQQDVQALLAACARTREYDRPGKRACSNARSTALRDKTIILLLLDTGIRASELCGLRPEDVDLKNRRIYVTGKGDKGRGVPISAETARALWRYMAEERAGARMSEQLFVALEGAPFDRIALLKVLQRLGERAGVQHVHPHLFRHTFAINFLRNGGNVYELQMALGHTTLDMVKTYLALAETDLQEAHREASPVTRWRLHV